MKSPLIAEFDSKASGSSRVHSWSLSAENSLFRICASILLVIGVAKVAAATQDHFLHLSKRDALITFLSVRQIMTIAGLLEIVIATFVWRSQSRFLRSTRLAWVASLIWGYRFGLWLVGDQNPCVCLGFLPTYLHLRPGVTSGFLTASLVAVTIVGFAPAFSKAIHLVRKQFFQSSTRLLVTLLACLLVLEHRVWSSEYEVKGKLHYYIDAPGGFRELPNMYREFTLSVSNHWWCLRSSNPEGNGRIKGYETASDGTNFYFVIRHNISDTNLNDASGVIESDNVPSMEFGIDAPVWWAYASGDLLNGSSRGQLPRILRWEDIEYRLRKVQVPAEWVTHPDAPQLPESIQWYNEGEEPVRTPENRQDTFRYPAPYQNGFLEAEYKTIEWTNSYGLAVPFRAVFKRFRPKPQGTHSNEISSSLQISMYLTSVSTNLSNRELLPIISGSRVHIEDRRFFAAQPSAMQIVYFTTNQSWLRTNDSELGKYYAPIAEARARALRRTSGYTVAFLVLGLGSLCWIVARVKRHHVSG